MHWFLWYQNLCGELSTLCRSHNSSQKVREPRWLGQNVSGSFDIRTCVRNTSLSIEVIIARIKLKSQDGQVRMRQVPSVSELACGTLHSLLKPQQPLESRRVKSVRSECVGFLQYQNLCGELFTLSRSHNSSYKVGEPSVLGQNVLVSFGIRTCLGNSSFSAEATIARRMQKVKLIRSKCIGFFRDQNFAWGTLLSQSMPQQLVECRKAKQIRLECVGFF